jgi:hypothetical protein
MKKLSIGIFILLLFVAVWSEGRIKYFKRDRIQSIKGLVLEVKNESCYQKKNKFAVIYLKEAEKDTLIRVEVSPHWFFKLDLKKDDSIEVSGSCVQMEGKLQVMVQTITFNGEIHHFRDKSGFPLWRGKGRFMKGKNKKKMRKRGWF